MYFRVRQREWLDSCMLIERAENTWHLDIQRRQTRQHGRHALQLDVRQRVAIDARGQVRLPSLQATSQLGQGLRRVRRRRQKVAIEQRLQKQTRNDVEKK